MTVLSSAQDFESFLPSRPCTARWGDCGTPPTPSCGASLWLVPYPSTSPPTLRSVLNFVEGPVVMIGCSRAEPALGSCNLMLRFHRKRQSVHYAEAKSGLKPICSFFFYLIASIGSWRRWTNCKSKGILWTGYALFANNARVYSDERRSYWALLLG